MTDPIVKEIADIFPNQAFLTVEDITQLLSCDKKVIYNWNRRANIKRRPPRITIGKMVRFPKSRFIEWLLREQCIQ